MRVLRRLLIGLVVVALALGVALAVNTARQGTKQLNVPPLANPVAVDERAAAESLGVAIRAKTVSSKDDAQLNADQFRALHEHLQQRYPKLHAALKREVVGELSLLYTWPGSDTSATAIVLMAHQDVVPIAPGTESKWEAEPFGGEVKGGYVWGRGAWDDKGNLIAQLEAVELLVASGFQPRRTVHLVFGADEEVGGERGARAIAKMLADRGAKLDFVIDEGLLVVEGVIAGLSKPAALIGVAEKGYLSVALKASATPGHSSMPPAPGTAAIAQVAQAVTRLDANPLPMAVGGVADAMFDTLAPEFDGLNRYALTNRWLLEPLLQRQLERGASTNALLRTTTALTIFNAGNKDNVLPGQAEAVVNFRLLPGDSQAKVLEHVRQTIANPAIEIQPLAGASEPSRVSSTASEGYRAIERTVRETMPGTVVAPGLMLGATDARHFEPFSKNVYRFSPVRAKPEDLARFHGTNERISTANLAELIRFYHRLIQQSAGPERSSP